MSLQVSTKFKQRILGRESFEDIFDGGRILIYSGAKPVSADHAVGAGTLLAQITRDGEAWVNWGHDGGLLYTRDGAYASKDPNQSWVMTAEASGTAAWFRLCGPEPDTGLLSYNLPRIDGSVGLTGASELVLSTLAINDGQQIPIHAFLFTIPPIVS